MGFFRKVGRKLHGETFFRNVVVNAALILVVAGILSAAIVPNLTSASGPGANGAVYRGNTANKNIALMFGIGRDSEALDDILAVLSEENVRLTFFIGGAWAARNPETLKKIHAAGHEPGNYGYYQKESKRLSQTRVQEEILITHKLVEETTGAGMNLFMPPGGNFNKAALEAAKLLNYKVIVFTRDTGGRRDQADEIRARAVKNMKNGDLILLHPSRETLCALRQIIKTIRDAGFNITTVSEAIK